MQKLQRQSENTENAVHSLFQCHFMSSLPFLGQKGKKIMQQPLYILSSHSFPLLTLCLYFLYTAHPPSDLNVCSDSSGAPLINSDEIIRELLLSGAVKEINISGGNPIRLRLDDNGSPQPVVCVPRPGLHSSYLCGLLPSGSVMLLLANMHHRVW